MWSTSLPLKEIKTGDARGSPTLAFRSHPEEAIFLAQGKPPFTIAYGSVAYRHTPYSGNSVRSLAGALNVETSNATLAEGIVMQLSDSHASTCCANLTVYEDGVYMRTLLIAVASVLACAASPAHGEQPEYLFILKGRGNVFWKVLREGVEETAKSQGINAVILNTDDDQTPEAQLNMCLASLARKPKVLVMGAHTKNVGIECFRKASAAGILTADVDGNVTVDDARQAQIPLAFSVGSDNSLIGQEAADYVARTTTKKAPAILVIKGLAGSIVSEKRAQGFIDRLKSALPDARIVGTPAADWDRMKAMNTSMDFMQREPGLDYIFSVSDSMTMGAIEAVRISGKKDQVKLLSVDGIADGRRAVVEGRMEANVAQLPYLMGKRAVELAVSAAAGTPPHHSELTPTPLLTASMLEKNDDPILQYLR